MTPDISIVIPAHEVRRCIGPAIDSALRQEGVSLEAIVVDDGSRDGTANEIDRFAGDPRLRVVRQENQGLPGARNAGVRAACARHIGFLDGDDLWEPAKARRHVELLDRRPDVDLSYSWWRTIDEDGHDLGRRWTVPPGRVRGGLGFEGLLLENFAGNGSTVVCRRDALLRAGMFDDAMRQGCEDLDAWLRIAALRDGNIALVPEVLTSYRMQSGQMTRDWRRILAGWEAAVAKARRAHPERVAKVEPSARARLDRYVCYIAYQNGDHAAARRIVARGWRSAPAVFAADERAWLLAAAIAAQALLPEAWHSRLAGIAKGRRWRPEPADPAAPDD